MIDHTLGIVRKRIAKLEPGDAEAVLRAYPRAAKLLIRDGEGPRSKPGDERPN